MPQYPVKDIYDVSRFIDFALRTVDERIAFEIDGLTWHVPDAERIAKYEDDLSGKTASCTRDGGYFAWTDRQVADEPDG